MKTAFTLGVATAALVLVSTANAYDFSGSDYYAYDGGMTVLNGSDQAISTPLGSVLSTGTLSGLQMTGSSQSGGGKVTYYGPPSLNGPTGGTVGLSFDGISQVNVRQLQGNLSAIPPDTMGAVGASQFMETTNGAYAIYNKSTGALESMVADGVFWQNAGMPDSHFANGDSRVLFDKQYQKWIVESFGPNDSQIQIAVSQTSDALGPWKSTIFTGFAGGIADYPTLAMDNNAVYIGTNDFKPNGSGGFNFAGTSLTVLNKSALFAAGGPTLHGAAGFFPGAGNPATDFGFAIQGVNQVGGDDSGQIVAIGAYNYGSTRYTIGNAGQTNAYIASGPTLVDPASAYDPNSPARQPDGSRVIDPLDDRISSSAFEYKGRIYTVHTITPTGTDHTAIEWNVVDAASNTLIQKGVISDPNYDFYQASIAVNNSGQVVMGYNRSGSGSDGNVSFFAQVFNPTAGGNGAIQASGGSILLHVSPIDNYHNGSVQSAPPAGRQRWGDYSQVTVDPNNPYAFWAIGEYALGYLPNPDTSFSRWGTWISEITIGSVPEPSTWAMMILGVGLVGASMRRRKVAVA